MELVIGITADFSMETMQAKGQWSHTFQVLKVKISLKLEFYTKRKYI